MSVDRGAPGTSPSGQALAHIRVADFTRTAAGPLCTQMLGDLGADVVKVERPNVGDETRAWEPRRGSESTYFLAFNRNKRSLTLDLSKPRGQSVAARLAASSDVVVESFRRGVMERFGLGYDDVAAENPSVVYCSVSSFGRTGPKADWAGYEAVAEAFGGLMSVTGVPGGPPMRAGFSLLDHSTGLLAFGGVMTALLVRERTGRGQFLETSLLDASMSAMGYHAQQYWATGLDPVPRGSAHPAFAPYEAIPARDGHVMVAVGNDRLWERFCTALDWPELCHDERFATNQDRVASRHALVQMIGERFVTRATGHWVGVLTGAGVPCSPVNRVSEVLADEHVRARGQLVDVDHPTIEGWKDVGMPVRYGAVPGGVWRPPPLLGQHTDEVLAELGFGGDEVEALRAEEVV